VATTTLHGLLTSMSRDGQVLALMSNGCNAHPAATITVLNRSTHQVRHWTGPKPTEVASLSGDGSVLVYATGSGVAVLPTSAADGSLASRSRIVAPNREFGHGTAAGHLRLAPNNTLYFATHHGNNGWQLRAYDLTTGRTRLLKDLPGTSLGIVSDPSGRYLLVRYGLNKVPPGPAGGPAARLVRLDTTTGKITRLAAHASGMDQFTGEAVLAW
jgi:ELWxxDGT repeat protein